MFPIKLELREIFKLAHHDVANNICDKVSQKLRHENIDFGTVNSIESLIPTLADYFSNEYRAQLETKMKEIVAEMISRQRN